MIRTRQRGHGFSYVEVLVAVVLLALCALPMADAIRNGMRAADIGATKANELRCMKNLMETVLAEPFDDLWTAALGETTPTSYSKPLDETCGARNVYIAKYEHRYNTAPAFAAQDAEDTLLLVTVSGPAASYTFSTLVDR